VVVVSVCLWVAYLAADAIGGVQSFYSASSTAASPQAIGVLAGGLVVDVVLLVFMVVMQSGRHWARVVLAVGGSLRLALGLFLLIDVLLSGASGASTGFVLVLLLLLSGAIVAMFMPAANAWFALSGRARRWSGS
jgi:hypothetical protein